jgi:hypothetical protein
MSGTHTAWEPAVLPLETMGTFSNASNALSDFDSGGVVVVAFA